MERSVAVTIKRRPDAGQRFPFVPLPRAIERSRALYKVASVHDVPFATAVSTWGYAEKSSGGAQTVAALKAFGLLEDVPGSDVRKVKLTDTALRIIRDPREISPDRDALVQQAAMRPPLHRDILEKYGGMPPSDEALRAFLLMDRGLKDEVVPEVIREFTATMAFAKLADQVAIQDMGAESGPDQTEVFLDSPAPNRPDIAPLTGLRLRDAGTQPRPSAPTEMTQPGARQEIFVLDEGDVVLTFPENLSAASYEDLEAHLQLFLRKAKRRAMLVSSRSHKSDAEGAD